MYTDEDLDEGISQGILTQESVDDFKKHLYDIKQTRHSDEEGLRLVSGFNDIFVVIACLLFMISSTWLLSNLNTSLAFLILALESWGLAEFFVKKKKLAMPSIVLLITFVVGTFGAGYFFAEDSHKLGAGVGASLTLVAIFFHWRRFKIPITIAALLASSVILATAISSYYFSFTGIYVQGTMMAGGLICFGYAMLWDSADTKRTTKKSDVAFWLHMLSAPLIVHPLFSMLGIVNGTGGMLELSFVLLFYIAMIVLSLIIDRRAFMVSTIIYVLYVMSKTFGNLEVEKSVSMAVTGVTLGLTLIFLSGFWARARGFILPKLPEVIRIKVP
jgi:hypothetical protein